jgi:methylphosphotriester-DNA--protein-cysteine methyltransferase
VSVDYQEWRPAPSLDGLVLAYWSVTGDAADVPSPAILPDAHVEIVVNLGDPVTLVGRRFSGRQPARCVVGLLGQAIEIHYGARVGTLGIRLHAARAPGFFGVAPGALHDTIGPLARVAPALDAHLASVVEAHSRLASADSRSALDAALGEQLALSRPADELVVRAVDRLVDAEAQVSVTALARELAISPRQLHRRFLAQVGASPKHVERLARFARTWQQATMGPPLGWADLAFANGYADQSHLVREFRAFGAQPPAHLFTAEWYDATNVARAVGPARGVRFLQDRMASSGDDARVMPEPNPPAKRRR